MDDIPIITEASTPSNKPAKPWKYILYTILGTTLSILLTFGTSQMVAQYRRAQERKLTALMVMGNIEKFASNIENVSQKMAMYDTIATYLLAMPVDSLDSPECEALHNLLLSWPLLTHDKSAENIFSNSIETWKNMGNFMFINGVGKMFAQMDAYEKMHTEFFDEIQQRIKYVKNNPDQFPGNSIDSKLLQDKVYRSLLQRYHTRANQYLYAAYHMRYVNKFMMKLMDISEEEVVEFAHKDDASAEEIVGEKKKSLREFVTPALDVDSLPDIHTWLGR